MAVAGLVLGILSVTVFFWAAPIVGGLWSAGAALTGNTGMQPAWPIWVVGLGLGVGVPVIALILSILGLKNKRGIAVAGLVTAFVGIVLGFIATAIAAFAVDVTSAAKDRLDAMPDIQQMQNTLDDPAFQERMKKAMEAAAEKQGAAAANPNAPAPTVLMPGQTPPSPAPAAEALPAEAPPEEAPKPPSGP